MAFGKPALDAEVPLSSRIQAIKLRLVKCNSVSEIADLVSTVTDEELTGLRIDYGAARALSLKPTTLYGKMRKHGIRPSKNDTQ